MFRIFAIVALLVLTSLALWLNLVSAPTVSQQSASSATSSSTTSSIATTTTSSAPIITPVTTSSVAISPRPTPADQPTVKPVPVKPKPVDPASKSIIINGVPFISQAPLGHWSDPLQANGCEEASVLMAVAWARGLSFDPNAAEAAIIAMGEYQIKHYGQAVDTDLADTLARLLVDYWDFDGAQVHLDFSKASLIKTLESGQLIILPANGRLLGNPYFTPPGPTTHMLVISGYDPASDQFITQDPGTRRGANFRYAAATVLKAAVNYPTGNHEAQDFSQRGFISVAR